MTYSGFPFRLLKGINIHRCVFTDGIIALCLIVNSLHALDQSTEYQARLVTHIQCIEKEERIGFAGWFILPNVMKTSPLRSLMLGGIVLNRQERWIEVMLGAASGTNGIVEPVVNLRALEKSIPWFELFSEGEYNFHSHRLYGNGILSTQIAGSAFRIGVEADLFVSSSGYLTSLGPRLAIQLPFFPSLCKNIFLITAYKIQSDNSTILRQYLIVNF